MVEAAVVEPYLTIFSVCVIGASRAQAACATRSFARTLLLSHIPTLVHYGSDSNNHHLKPFGTHLQAGFKNLSN